MQMVSGILAGKAASNALGGSKTEQPTADQAPQEQSGFLEMLLAANKDKPGAKLWNAWQSGDLQGKGVMDWFQFLR